MSEEGEDKMGCGVCAVKCWTMEGFLGDVSTLKYVCKPTCPCLSKGGVRPPKYLGKDDKLPLVISLTMGLQHALAMIAGIATSGGFLIANDTCLPWQKDAKMCAAKSFLISTAWITSGILTAIQVFRAKVKGTPFYLGTGLISVMGTSFTFLPIAREMTLEAIGDAKAAGVSTDFAGMEGYGKFLGTCMVASLLEILISMLPKKIREAIFPPVVVGIAVMMIGASLIGAGIKYLGGGVFCGENMVSRGAAFGGPQICNEQGEVMLSFGSPEYVMLGVGTIAFGTLLQIFGSPFLKSTYIFWSLMFGCFLSGVATKGDAELKYWVDGKIEAAPAGVFLWSEVNFLEYFGFDPAYFLPILIGFYISSAETVGDVKMTAYYSKIDDPEDVDKRIQGGLLADGVNSFLATFFCSPPNTTFSQNNGVIALSRCASRSAGFSCSVWLILFGIFGKIGAAFASIPICVVGGVVLQCFTMVFVAGMGMLAECGVGTRKGRRNSYIAMLSIAFGIGVALEPQLFDAGVTSPSSFYHTNLGFNYGFWPKHMVCENKVQKTINTPSSCVISASTTYSGLSTADCTTLGGTFTASSSTTQAFPYCSNNNGFCCTKWKKGDKNLRTAVMFMLKTPYCIGTIIAAILNAILPKDAPDDEDDDAKPTKTAVAEA